jgi:REP element-mobilizing transposase RayT
MSIRKTIFHKNGIYHIYNRTITGTGMSLDKEDYAFFVLKLRQYAKLLQIRIISWCLLPNHFHMLVQQLGDHTPSKFIERLLKSYVKWYNKKYLRRGPLFESRFKSTSVADEEYLKTVLAYILCNPVHHRLIRRPEKWRYSNYPEIMAEKLHFLELETFSLDMQAFRCFFSTYLEGLRKKRISRKELRRQYHGPPRVP